MNNFRRRGSARTITGTELRVTDVSMSGGGKIDIIDGGPKTLTTQASNNLVIDVRYYFKCCLRTYYSDGSFEDSSKETFEGTMRFDQFYIDDFSTDDIKSVIKTINTPYGDVSMMIDGSSGISGDGTVMMEAYVHYYVIDYFYASYQEVANNKYSVTFFYR